MPAAPAGGVVKRFWTSTVILGAAGVLTACPWPGSLVINSVIPNDTSLQVGGKTQITIEATTLPGRTLNYRAQADRGRIYPLTTTTSKVLTYYAPYAARGISANGTPMPTDRIQITVDDGAGSVRYNIEINLVGSMMAYVQAAQTISPQGTLMLAQTDETGQQVYATTPLLNNAGQSIVGAEPAISPDGRFIAYVVYSSGSETSGIYVVDSSRRVQTVVPAGSTGLNLDPSWSPDGQRIAFASKRSGQFDIYHIAVGEGMSPEQFTSTPANERFPAWNPNLQRKAYIALSAQANNTAGMGRDDPNAAWNLFIYDTDQRRYPENSQLTALSLNTDYAIEPHWNREGTYLAYTYYGPIKNQMSSAQRYQRIYLQDTAQNAGSGVQLNTTVTDPNVYESNPVWSQSGNQLIYLSATGTPESMLAGTVYRQTINGMASAQVAPQPWASFSSVWIPSFFFGTTQRQLIGGNSLGWN